jgi:hypothetical protein
MGYITMNDKEREQSKIFESVRLHQINKSEAAARLKDSTRWVRKKLPRYFQNGDLGLIHKIWLEFVAGESVNALMQATKNYLNVHGIPQSFYTDHGSVFHVNLNNKEEVKKTQWEHAVGQLGIDVIHANSPQAKGRVERCNQTMQDRLIKDMRIAKVSTMQEANNFLRTSNFINSHNALFSARSAQEGNAHRSIELYDLDAIFCIKTRRVLANDFTITYKNQIFQLHKHQRAFIRPKDEIVVSTLLDGSIRLSIRKIDLNFSIIKHRQEPNTQKEKLNDYKPRIVSENSRLWVNGKLPQSRVKPALPAAEAFV